MAVNLAKDWPVFIMLGGMLYFFAYVIIKSNMPEKKDKNENSDKTTKNKE